MSEGAVDGDGEASRPTWNLQQPSKMVSSRYHALTSVLDTSLPDRTWPDRVIAHAPLWVPVDLRDGNQALIEPMDAERKLRMFKMMVGIGFKEIEVGYPAASTPDYEFVRQLIDENLVPEDVSIVVLTPAREDLIARTFEAIEGGSNVIVHLYNATAPLWRETVFGVDKDGAKEIALAGTRCVLKHVRARQLQIELQREIATKAIEDFEEALAVHARADAAPALHPQVSAAAAEGMRSEIESLRTRLQAIERERVHPLRLEYSPECFSMTEREIALDICNAVIAEWKPTPESPMIINLPATVEAATPNVYADQIEYAHRGLCSRDAVILSVHTHNDRGTGVAAAELALQAGAQRVEGCLFGNGERTGNVDLLTLALNLHSQGVDCQLDLSDVDGIRHEVEYCNRLPVHPRHPYVGELVYTSFSGTHQDAINKGFARREELARTRDQNIEDLPWEMPYLPIDPKDVGRSYEAVIRVNSQSGKGGITYLLEADHGLKIPRALQIELAHFIQPHAELSGGEITSAELWTLFEREFMRIGEGMQLRSSQLLSHEDVAGAQVSLRVNLLESGAIDEVVAEGRGEGTLEAFVNALAARGHVFTINDYHEHAIGSGEDARAAAYVQVRAGDESAWGVGIDSSITTASFKAALAAFARIS
jgi:2-isopropylmalate synthase